ncbi:MAG TPA: hypothetical protein VK636_22665 [Gemmatimonadaceae bacterium]|nr:hypothetical protein [Gemmatimonadaceae bacterium]
MFALVAVPVNEYVDQTTVALGLTLCIQTHIALLLERMRRDPFVILLAFGMIFYFALRIFTLALVPVSLVFGRFGFSAADSNYALVFIIIANACMYGGLIAVRFRRDRGIDSREWRAASPRSVIALMLVTFSLAYFSTGYWTVANLPRALTVLVVLLSPPIVVSMALAYYLLFRASLSRRAALAIGLMLILEIAAHTLWGSRSAIVGFVQTILLVALAVSGSVKLNRGYVVLGIVLLPVAGALMVVTYAISTYNRLAREALGGKTLDVGFAVQSAREAGPQLFDKGIDVVLPPVLARMGFFDFSAEIIAHREEYSRAINLTTYGKSIIDNILTPGFDIFDQPKISNALRFVYFERGAPSKIAVEEAYHSDQLGIYGEFYALFGYASLILFFLVPYCLKRVYVHLRANNPFAFAMKRVVVLLIFQKMIDSFGIDWIIGEMAPFVVAMGLYSVFFSTKRIVASTIESGQSTLPGGLANA